MVDQGIRNKLNLLYKILVRISLSGKSDWKTKIYVNVALSYFIIPEDVVPDNVLEEKSFVDDLYVCLLIINDLRKYRKEILMSFFSEYIKESVDQFLSENLHECETILGNKIELIKKEVGYDSLNKINLHDKEFSLVMGQELLGVIAFLYDELLKSKKVGKSVLDNLITVEELFFDVEKTIKEYRSTLKEVPFNELSIEDVFVDYETKLGKIDMSSKYRGILKFALPIFKILYGIQKSPRSDWVIKHEINCALAYFALSNDVIADTIKEGTGFVDDLFLGSFVLFDIYIKDQRLILEHISNKLNIDDIMYVLEESSELLSKDSNEILNFLGLKSLLNYSGVYLKNKNSKDDKVDDKLKEVLIGLLNLYLGESINKQADFKIVIPYLKNIKNTRKLGSFIDIAMRVVHDKKVELYLEQGEDKGRKLLELRQKLLTT